uniref:NADH dehydrogenase subunit 4 n=1 Tax=Micrarionta opuntia TaxID=2914219 RepID=UPI001EF9E36E|nr:NADH dehydrogenase subunit 4 [Micrarionta opuntia]UKG20831.1 NADH dehydrogenase subunit 4 [Micrarionta opuntia]
MLSLLMMIFGMFLLFYPVSVVSAFILLIPLGMLCLNKSAMYVQDMLLMFTHSSMLLGFLTLSLFGLTLVATYKNWSRYYSCLVISMALVLMLCFSISDFLLFYIFFESSLIPIFLMILSWGYQQERLQASLYMVMYTVFGSLPLLLIILYINMYMSSSQIFMITIFSFLQSGVLFLGFAAFMVKLPIYCLHLWLPKAHVEAPLGGSMLLAGVLLKLGGYGAYMYSYMMPISLFNTMSVLIMSISIVGGVLASAVCLMQSDVKAMIAYSSIVHMSFVMFGLMTMSVWGYGCAVITMLAHGWVSAGLFLTGYISYLMTNSRSFSYNKGVLVLAPMLSFFWCVLCIMNMGVPPTINFIGEIMVIPASMFVSLWMFIGVGMVMFMSVGYNMYLYTRVNHGNPSKYMSSSKVLLNSVMLALVLHLMPLSFIGNMDLLVF